MRLCREGAQHRMASGLNASARVLRVVLHCGLLVCRMLNMVSRNVLVASCKIRDT